MPVAFYIAVHTGDFFKIVKPFSYTLMCCYVKLASFKLCQLYIYVFK